MTQRSKSELDAFFVTNTQGLVTQAHVRDLIDSMIARHGSLYVTAPSPTAIAVPGTFYKAAGATALGAAHGFTSPVDNRLTYTGIVPVTAHIVVNISTKSSGNNQLINFAVARNGVVIPHSIMEHYLTTGADVKIMAIHADALLATNDYLELWCTNTTSTATVTAQRAYMYVMGMICDDVDDCTMDSCNEAADTCAHPVAPDGTLCAASGGCFVGGTCTASNHSTVTSASSFILTSGCRLMRASISGSTSALSLVSLPSPGETSSRYSSSCARSFSRQ